MTIHSHALLSMAPKSHLLVYCDFFDPRLLGSPSLLRSARSPSASHLLAFTSWTTLITCFKNMMGKEEMHRIQGMVESILLALFNLLAHRSYA